MDIIAFTGHRPHKLDNDYDLKSKLIQDIKAHIIKIVSGFNSPKFITGMALGIDTLVANIAVERNIPFIAAIPFKGQHRVWIGKSQGLYHILLSKAEQIKIVDSNKIGNYKYYLTLPETAFQPAKMHKRNQWMVDNCDVLIAIWDGSQGGTYSCIEYATRMKKRIIRIDISNRSNIRVYDLT